MSVVIVGGNECMEGQYKRICKSLGHTARVYTKPCAALRCNLGRPDLVILFVSTASHAMARCALNAVKGAKFERCQSSSAAALKDVLAKYQ